MTTSPQAPPSPLTEAEPASLEELFSRNPIELTDSDVDRIITEERRLRAKLATAAASAPVKATRGAPKETGSSEDF